VWRTSIIFLTLEVVVDLELQACQAFYSTPILNTKFFSKWLNLPPQTLMSWNGLTPCPLCWVSHLAHPNRLAGNLPNIIGKGLDHSTVCIGWVFTDHCHPAFRVSAMARLPILVYSDVFTPIHTMQVDAENPLCQIWVLWGLNSSWLLEYMFLHHLNQPMTFSNSFNVFISIKLCCSFALWLRCYQAWHQQIRALSHVSGSWLSTALALQGLLLIPPPSPCPTVAHSYDKSTSY
jgi:hypothetical protein